ncbi:uncharacterized protein LOC9654494 [Selaginella moellendorffii]|nr:uncharacterized protein LOC9654494 [Selaginella moellendorffii]|eukprot:XP_002983233.2 uncharacterized protein LOC9654494 [Selaginella moellendorffii]
MDSSSSLSAMASAALGEISKVFERAQELGLDPVGRMVREIGAGRDRDRQIVLYGVGREGLMLKALAMRLFHLGLKASCVGDMGAPRIGAGDLLICSAGPGPGSFATVDGILRVANKDGARVMLLTAQRVDDIAGVDSLVVLPARTMADDVTSGSGDVAGVLPMGSVYEGALFVLFELVVLELRAKLGESVESMRARHTNLE